MAAGNPKVLLHLELKNKLKGAFGQAKDYVNANVKQLKDKISSLRTAHIEAFQEMTDRIPGLSSAIGMLKSPVSMAIAGALALGAAFSKASAMASQFDTAMAKVNVTAKMSSGELAVAKGQVLDIAGRSTLANAVQAAPEALGVMISGGMDKDTAMKSLEPALQAAKVGFTDVGTAARAATAVMNSSGIKDATKVYDVLAMTLNRGNAEFADIANYLPKIVPGAKDAGFNLEQVAGAFAYLTAQGQTSEKAATMLENAFKALSDPERVKDFKRIGVAVYDNAGKMKPLADIVDNLKGKLDGLTDKNKATILDSLGLDMEGRGAFSAMAQDAGLLRDIINDTTNATGEMGRQFEAAKTPMDSWVQISNWLNTVWVRLGDAINNIIVGPLGQWLVDHKTLLETVGIVVLGVAAAWGTYLLVTNAGTIAVGALTVAQWALNAALAANPIGLVVTVVGLLIGGLVAAYQKSETFRAALSGIMEVAKLLGTVFTSLGKILVGTFTLDYDMVKSGMVQHASAMSDILSGGIERAFDKGFADSKEKAGASQRATQEGADRQAMYDREENALSKLQNNQRNATVKDLVKGGKTKKEKGEETGIISGAKNIRQTSVSIDSFIKGDFISQHQDFAQMSPKDLEKWFSEMLNRAVRNMEAGYS